MVLIPELMPNEYIALYSKRQTRYQKHNGIRRYLGIYLERDVDDIDMGMQEYLQRPEKQIADDLLQYGKRIAHLAPKTQALYQSTIEVYLADCCDFALSGLQKKMQIRGRPEKIRAVTIDANPTREMIRHVLAHCDERMTAEILISVSSGLRFGEVLHLRFTDIDHTTKPVTIHVRGEISKNGEPRTTYLSYEAAEALHAYLRVRDSVLERSLREIRRGNPEYDFDYSRIFPWSVGNEGKHMATATDAAGYIERDPRTKRRKVHYHLWRKFFLTQAKRRAGVPFVEAWAGHAGYLTSSYHKPSIDEDQAEYLKCEPDLTINIPDDYLAIKIQQATEIQRLYITVANQQRVIQDLSDKVRASERPRGSTQVDEYEAEQ